MWDDDNDEELLRAIEASRRLYEEEELPRLTQRNSVPLPVTTCAEESLPGPSTSTSGDSFKRPFPSDSKNDENVQDEDLYDGPEAEGFNFKTGQFWIYPTSDKYPVRTYQRDIVEKALFTNTLVSLPTGLGKTFIAAVVMYNFYMWYPKGKIIFMAPTKPLVAQQIENCINIVGIPESHTAEMTGALSSKMRAVMWKEKRVFFLTPQCVQNDLSSNVCPANDVKCVVIDEAHRALGDHAYAQVIRILNSYEARFRVLALSATPGSDLEAVQKVLCNLMISHIELRGEDSQDIVKYTHQRNLELMVVDVGPTINRIRVKYVGIAAEYAKTLQQRKLLFGNISNMHSFTVLKEWESFRREGSKGMDPGSCNRINTDFAIVHAFVHGLELLQTYGLRLLLNHMKGALNKGDASSNRLSVNEDFRGLMEEIELVLNPIDIDVDEKEQGKKRMIYGHPKLDRLQEVVASHFENFQQKGEATRAIVFCEYREGVIEICNMLKHFQPLIKPVAFMGQSAGKTSKGISQKLQLEIMEKFKKGIYNTLISTSVGEEGLDIGEVDLIICFDAKNSPIRQVQRMGRTGRKRQGRIIMLVTRGKEEQKYNQGLFKKKNVSSVLLNRENLASHLLEESPPMLPPGVKPKYTERKVEQVASKPKKSNQQDLRKMFQKRSSGGSGTTTSKPSISSKTYLGKPPFLSEDEFEELKLTWDNVHECCKFDKIPNRTEFWSKPADNLGTLSLAPNNIDLSTYLEYMRYPQRTHVIANSAHTQLLSNLLLWADDRRDEEAGALFGGLSSQITSTQIWPAKSKKRGRPPAPNSDAMNPPKKRGRPRKNAIPNSPAKVEENILSTFFPPIKPKSKPQFIEDDEFGSPVSPNVSPAPKPSSSSAPSPKLQTNLKPSVDFKSPPDSAENVITLISDDEDDLDSSTSSCFAYLSSQPSRQDLFLQLSTALQNLAVDDEDDECSICDTLFSCKPLNRVILGRKGKSSDSTWSSVRKSLEDALVLVPQLTKSALSKCYKPANESQKLVSLLPKFEIAADDDVCDGMLCGGMGDFSPPRSISPQKTNFSPLQDMTLKSGQSRMKISDCVNNKLGMDEIAHATPTPRKDEDAQRESSIQHKFEDVNFDFLGLSSMDDVFGCDTSDDKCDTKAEIDKKIETTSTKAVETSSKAKVNLAPQVSAQSPGRTMGGFPNQTREVTPVNVTPTKENCAIAEQVSPILCSQAVKKPWQGLRLRKQISPNEVSKPGVKDNDNEDPSNRTDFQTINSQTSPGGEVTSSSLLNTTHKSFTAPVVNFDLCDDSFFQLSDDDNCNKSEIDEALKETIRKKALEAKTKQSNLTFTQELDLISESTTGGLTQIMDMFEAKEKSPELKIERADSSSSLGLQRVCISPCAYGAVNLTKNEDIAEAKSEEDLFADCDDSLFCRVNSSDYVSTKSPVTLQKTDDGPDTSVVCKNNIDCSSTEAMKCTSVQCDKDRREEEETIPNSDRSLSPVFMQSQTIKRPSKLSLRKKKETLNEPVKLEKASTVSSNNSCDKFKDKRPAAREPEKDQVQTNLNSQIDFSMFGDEFNNSWLCSPTDEVVNAGDVEPVMKSKESSGFVKDSKKASVTSVEGRKIDTAQNTRTTRDRSPENELDLAFAQLDASRREQKKSCEGASSTPKTLKTSKWFQSEVSCASGLKKRTEFNTKRQLPGRTPFSERETVHGASATLKQKLSFSIPSPVKNGWLSTSKPNTSSNENSPSENSPQNKVNLSDFCDNSLLDVLEDGVCDILMNEEPHRKKKLSLGKKNTNNAPVGGNPKMPQSVPSNTGKEDDVILLSSDDEIGIQNKRKGTKCFLNVTSSSEEGCMLGKSVCGTEQETSSLTRKRNRDLSSSSDSFIQNNRPAMRKKIPKMQENSTKISDKSVLNLSSFCDESVLDALDSDQENSVQITTRPQKRGPIVLSSDDDDFVRKVEKTTKTKKRTKKHKKSKKGNGFIVSEAEESDDGVCNSSDGESTSLDELDSSFINDSQPDASQSVVDIQAKYLQSVRSPANHAGRFKIPGRMPQMNMDVYSQYPDADELNQTYADDSFCVDDEPTQYETEMSLLEIAEAQLKAEKREKRKLKKALESGESSGRSLNCNSPEKENRVVKKRLKRIKVFEETMCDDEDAPAGREHEEPAPTTKVGETSPIPKTVSETRVSKGQTDGNETMDELLEDLALLLDDDLDFSAIPDIPDIATDVTDKAVAPSKFVKKTPMLTSDGSTFKVNPQSSWKIATNSFNVHNNVQSTSRQSAVPGAVSSAASSSSKNSHPASIPQKMSTSGPTFSGGKATAPSTSSRSLIIASSRQVAASPDLLRVLRVNYLITIVPHSVPDADFIISWRLGVSRVFASDMRDKKKLEELVKKMKLSYSKPYLIVESDRIKSLATAKYQKKSKKAKAPPPIEETANVQSPWSSSAGCGNAALLQQAGIQLLFSQNFDESARFLANLAKKEINVGHGIPEVAHNLPDEVETRLQFFCSLPGVNYAFALKLLAKFATVGDFLARCSSVRDIATNFGVDVNAARRIHNVLCEVHISP